VFQVIRYFSAAIGCGVLFLVPTFGHAQAAPWQNDWIVQKAPSLQYSGAYAATAQAPLVYSPDGEIVMRAASQNLNDQIVRFDMTGGVRWRVSIGGSGGTLEPEVGAMLANSDGSAYATAQYGEFLVRIDATGSITWSVPLTTRFLAATPQVLLAEGCDTVTSIDPASGQLLWQRVIGVVGGCAGTGLVIDPTGNSYASLSIPSGSVYEVHLRKFDASGKLLWDAQRMLGSAQRVVGTSGGLVYVADGTDVHALRTSDGSTQWDAAGAAALGIAGFPAELIVSTASGVQRLDAAAGSARWTQPAAAGGGLVASCSGTNKVVLGRSRLDLATGTIDWTAPLPDSDGTGGLTYFSALCAADGITTFAAIALGDTSGAAPRLQRVDANGALLDQVPVQAGAQGVIGNSGVADAHTVVSSTTEYPRGTVNLRLRAVATDDGATRWEKLVGPSTFGTVGGLAYAGLATRDGAAAVTLASEYVMSDSHGQDGVWVALIDAPSGAVRWSTKLYRANDPLKFQAATVAYDPLLDAQGNVIVSYATSIYDSTPPGSRHSQLSVVKLNALDGSVLWQHDEYFPIVVQFQFFPPAIFLSGSDVLVGGPFTAPNDSKSLLKLSGADGSVKWTSDVFLANSENGTIGTVDTVDDGNLVVFGLGAWAKLDAQSGAVLWTNANTSSCTGICVNGGGEVALPGGDILAAGQNASRAQFVLFPAHPNATSSTWRFDEADTHIRQSYAYGLFDDAAGNHWSRLQRNYRYYGQRTAYLVRFDPASGSLLSQQALYTTDRDPLLPWLSPMLLAAPENNHLLASTYNNVAPAPETSGVALIDTAIRANGNLSVTLSTGRSVASPGQRVGFLLTVTYSGDAPATGVRLIADFPWTGHASELVCVAPLAANCVIDGSAGTLVASFDMQPGATINVVGSMRADVEGRRLPVSALVVGPTALSELDISDNSAWLTVEPAIFINGFE